MNQDELISIIVPVYKVEDYLPRCVESILRQTYPKLEVLLVDDGSPDGCGEICDRYAEQFPQIHAFHISNGGVSAARNFGIERAKGRYLVFIDSDDFVSPCYIEALYLTLRQAKADLAICSWENVPEKQAPENLPEQFEPFCLEQTRLQTYTPEQALKRLLYQDPFDAAPWAKIYKRELFEDIRFPLGFAYEDYAILPKIFIRSKQVAYYPYPGYKYLLRDSGITLRKFFKQKMQLVQVADENETFILEQYPALRPAVYSRTVCANLHIYMQIPFRKEFATCRKQIVGNIYKRRWVVLMDPEASLRTKFALCLSFAGLWTIRVFRLLKMIGKK